MRKIEATQKMGAKGVCMLWVVSVISGVEEIMARLFYTIGCIQIHNGRSVSETSKHHKKAKRKKDSHRAQNGTRPKQKDTNTQKDTAKGHAGLLPI